MEKYIVRCITLAVLFTLTKANFVCAQEMEDINCMTLAPCENDGNGGVKDPCCYEPEPEETPFTEETPAPEEKTECQLLLDEVWIQFDAAAQDPVCAYMFQVNDEPIPTEVDETTTAAKFTLASAKRLQKLERKMRKLQRKARACSDMRQ